MPQGENSLHRILVAERIAEEGLAELRSHPELVVDFAPGLPAAELRARLAESDALVVRSATGVTAEVIGAAPRLKVIGRAGIGVDNIDVDAATERGIVVLNTPDANATTTAELAVAHLFSLSRHLPQADRSVRRGEWQRSRFMGQEIAGKTLGIIGFGTIGRIVADRALGLRMRVTAYDPFVTREAFAQAGVEPLELDALLEAADYVTLHCPLLAKTRNLIDTARLARMKPQAFLINCARGGLVDEEALCEALRSGRIAGAALDVYSQEPPSESPLLGLDNVLFTPHLGASTHEAQVAVSREIARQVAAFLCTGEAVNAVNLPRLPAEELDRLRPYQTLTRKLGHLLALFSDGALSEVEVALYGRASEVDAHAVAVEALVGLLGEQMSVPVNRVNAPHLARRQGIKLLETRCEESRDYVSLVTVTARGAGDSHRLAGTLLGERHPRLVYVDDCEIEAVPEGHLLITLHEDRPGVVGALGTLLSQHGINISRMQVGVVPEGGKAVAVIGVSEPLSPELLDEVTSTPAVGRALQVSL